MDRYADGARPCGGAQMSGFRQAALALYGLAARDQKLILAQLPAEERRILRAHLAELATLGFDPALADAGPAPRAAAAPVAVPTAFDQLAGAGAAAMLEILEHEPATLVAQFMQIKDWPWAADFIDLLPAPRRALVRGALQAEAVQAPARQRFLLEAVAAALPAIARHQNARPSARGAAWHTRVTSWMR